MENSLNCFNITGTVIAHGIKGGKFPRLWIKIGLEPITLISKNSSLDNISIFVSIDLDPNETSKKGLLGKHVQESLKTHKFIFIPDISFANLSRSKKDDKGEWTSVEEPGYRANIRNIVLSNTRFDPINTGFLSGKVITQTDKKVIIKQNYRVPGKDGFTYKSRDLPVFLDTDLNIKDVTNKNIYITGKISFSSEKDICYVISTNFITYD